MLIDDQTAATKHRARILWRLGCASLLLALLVLVATCWTGFSNWSEAQLDARLSKSDRTYEDALDAILEDVKDAETGQRGFILTGQERYLQPYNHSLQPIEQSLQTLATIAAARPDQAPAIAKIQSQTRIKMSELALTIELRRTKGFDAALAELLTDRGRNAMDQIRAECKQASNALAQQAVRRSEEASRHQRNAIAIATAGGSLLFLLMVAGFVTLTKGANQQALLAERLANSREIFETTLTSIGDGVIATSVTGQITFINPQAARLTGWPREEAVGKPLDQVFSIVNETSRAKVESPFEMVIRAGSIVGLANHTILIRKDGSEIPIDDSGAPIRSVYGQISGVVLVFRDVSNRREAEASLRLSHDEVLKANEELRQFSYAATHDLQEPLRTIVVFSQLLGRGYKQVLDARGQHLLQTVEEAAHRMSLLIDDLLAYTRAGGTASSTNQQPVDATSIVTETLTQLHGAMEESGASITFDPLPVVLSDPAQLSQVFQNLLSNAIKYRKPGVPPVIHISSTIEGDRVTFRVADNGMGFKQEYADKIFLLFQRLHGRAIPGTGIGLSLCRRIVERHGGRIWARSEENIGTSFYFTLPVARESAASA